jgi:hypothetical protein
MTELGEDMFDGEAMEEDDADNEQELEAMLEAKPKDTWASEGGKRDEVVRELIRCFGSMVESREKEYALADHNGRFKMEDMQYEKLLDAPKYVARAKR